MPMCSHAVGEVFLVEDMQTLGFGGPLIHVYACVHTRYVHWLVHTWWWMAGVSLEGESPSYTFAFLCMHTNANLYAGGGCWISDMSSGELYFSIVEGKDCWATAVVRVIYRGGVLL